MEAPTNNHWYREGLQFGCRHCGRCCTGESGTIRVTQTEIELLARRLEITPAVFRKLYTRRLTQGYSLREERQGDCVFFDRYSGCSIYSLRPRQCRTWPFWHSVVQSPREWARTGRECPGIDRGPRHPYHHIRRLCRDDGTFGGLKLAGVLPD